MAKLEAIFLDNRGVLTGNALRLPQRHGLVGRFFSTRFGGTVDAWAKGDEVTAQALGGTTFEASQHHGGYRLWWRHYLLKRIRGAATLAGADCPSDDDICLVEIEEGWSFCAASVTAALQGSAEAVEQLAGAQFRMFTASSDHSLELSGMLQGMMIRQRFERLYGPDLVNQSKDGADYYAKLFVHADVAPRRVLVVDNSERCVIWVDSAGAQTCLVAPKRPNRCNTGAVIPRLADLPELLERLA